MVPLPSAVNRDSGSTTKGVTTLTYKTNSSLGSYAHSLLSETSTSTVAGWIGLMTVAYEADGYSTFSQQESQAQNASQTLNIQTSTTVLANTTNSALASSNANWSSSGTYSYSENGVGNNSVGTLGFSSVVFRENTQSAQTFTSGSFNTFTSVATGDLYNGMATSTQSTSLGCWQSSIETLYTAGSSNGTTWNLSSYVLDSTATLTAYNNSSNNGNNIYSGTDTSGNLFKGSGTSNQSQSNTQQQVSQWHQEGTANNGNFNLSLVSFTSSANYTSTSYSYSNQSASLGTNSNNDMTTINASANGSFTENAIGSYLTNPSVPTLGQFGTVTLTGGSSGSYTLTESGAVNSTAYAHGDTFSETTTLSLSGSCNPWYSSGFLQYGWSFNNYNQTTTSHEVLSDTLNGITAGATIDAETAILSNGSGTQGTQTISGSGSSYWSNRNYTYSGSKSTNVNLSAPYPLIFTPVAQHSWLVSLFPVNGGAPTPSGLTGIAQILQGVATPSTLGAALPPLWNVLIGTPIWGVPVPPAYGGWLLPQGAPSGTMLTPTWAASPWTFENSVQKGNWILANQAFQDVLSRAQSIAGRSPTALSSKDVFTAEASRLGAEISGDFWAALGQLQDFIGGVANVVTTGLSNRLLNAVGGSWLVDTSSNAYQAGQYSGMALLMVLPSGGAIGTYMLAMQVAGNLWNAYDSFRAGDYASGTVSLMSAVFSASRLLGSMRGTSSVVGGAGSAGGGVSSAGPRGLATANRNFLGAELLRSVGSSVRDNAIALTTPATTWYGSALQGMAVSVFGYGVSALSATILTGQSQFSASGFWSALAAGTVAGAVFGVGNQFGWTDSRLGMFLVSTGAGLAGGAVGGGVLGTMEYGFGTAQMWQSVGVGATSGIVGGALLGLGLGSSANLAQMSSVRLLGIGFASGIAGGAVAGGIQGYLQTGTFLGTLDGIALGTISGGFAGLATSGAYLGLRAYFGNTIPNTPRNRTVIYGPGNQHAESVNLLLRARPGSRVIQNLNEVQPGDTLVLVGHGDSTTLQLGSTNYSAPELAQLLAGLRIRPSEIELFACGNSNPPPGGVSFADQFAAQVGIPITAYPDNIYPVELAGQRIIIAQGVPRDWISWLSGNPRPYRRALFPQEAPPDYIWYRPDPRPGSN